MTGPWRIGVWAAVSSQAQASDDKISLDEQERQGREFAASVGGEVVAVYTVGGHSRDLVFWAEAEAEMEAYRQVRADLEAGRVDVIHCVDADRLGRDPALVSQFYSLAERHGAEVYDASMPHPLGQQTTGHRYGTAIKAVSAGEDQKRRTARHRMGMKGRVERRGLLPGVAPFYLDPVRDEGGDVTGYEFSDQAGALDLMTRLFLAGHSYAEIRRRMDASPYPPPGNSVRWWHRTIWETLRSDVPAGVPAWGPFRAGEPSPHLPARWDAETHAAVIRERQRRARSGYHRRGSGPLSGVAFCARCGGGMTRHKARRMREYYLRCNRHASRSVYPHYACHPNHIREPAAVAAVGEFFQWLATPEVLDEALAELGAGQEGAALRAELAEAEAQAARLEARKVRLGHAYAAGDMEISVYRQVNADLSGQLEAAQAEAAELARVVEALPDVETRRALLEGLVDRFAAVLAEREPAEVATLLQQAGVRVEVEEGEVVRIRLG